MIGAGAIAADAQTSDDLATLIKSNAAAECDDASNELVGTRARRKEIWVEWVGIVEAVKRASRLGGRIKVGGGEGQARIAEIIGRVGLGNRDGTAAWPRIASLDYGAEPARPVHHRGPHEIL